MQPLADVLAHDQAQPESTITFAAYLARIVNDKRVAEGRRQVAAHRDLLARVAKRYGVPAGMIVALWGIESDFGRATGGFPVIAALASLAYGGRRAAFFRGELIAALKVLDGSGMTAAQMSGSWAGAMGQCQFMPSTYLRYAVSWTGEGRPDIWGDPADVFASTANYLSSLGWKSDELWGREVDATRPIPDDQLGLGLRKTVREWGRLGVRRADGHPLPASAIQASLIRPAASPGDQGLNPLYLAYDNFRVLTTWNRSTYFAISAGTLADRIGNR